jgi:ABC-type phosphate/phosphonate transport system permease subunit
MNTFVKTLLPPKFLPRKFLLQTDVVVIVALVSTLVSISLSAILIRFAESEMTPQAITFNRFCMGYEHFAASLLLANRFNLLLPPGYLVPCLF